MFYSNHFPLFFHGIQGNAMVKIVDKTFALSALNFVGESKFAFETISLVWNVECSEEEASWVRVKNKGGRRVEGVGSDGRKTVRVN